MARKQLGAPPAEPTDGIRKVDLDELYTALTGVMAHVPVRILWDAANQVWPTRLSHIPAWLNAQAVWDSGLVANVPTPGDIVAGDDWIKLREPV